ncbi:hypothetical protein [Nocardiopsis sp. NRRL B-16309]|uniref:hypothetical protein n=1 Tax=Nocardiopsis sp. NRRL B-16309 TaxID=1519494 RepID=UPI0012E23477|nr:hypothetical protein [Nocardiopsis sp. NRRL B-16309]
MTVHARGDTVTSGPGDILHVPENSPGELRPDEDTELACVVGFRPQTALSDASP